MADHPAVRAVEHWPGVYLLSFPDREDGVLVDRTRATARWVATADVVIEPAPGDDVACMVLLAALRYRSHLRPALTRRSPRPGGNA